jgi:acyl-CoA thioester hydrolase
LEGSYLNFSTELVVRYVETDKMGIVHHSNYPIWFEVTRVEFIKEFGYTNTELENRGILLPLRSLECNYIRPAKFEDLISINISVINFTCVKIDFKYSVLRKTDNKLLAEGVTKHAWTNKDLVPLNIKKIVPDLYNKIKNFIE